MPDSGFTCSYPTTFDYAEKRGVSPDVDYLWLGKPNASTYDGTKWDGKVAVGGKPIDPISGFERHY